MFDFSSDLHFQADALRDMLEPARCALVIIDVQVDFASPTGAMARMGADLTGVTAAVRQIGLLIAAARTAGVAVVFVRLETSADTDSEALKRLNARSGRPPEALDLCRKGGSGAAYFGVAPRAGDLEVTKRLFNAFHGTDLEPRLRALGVDTLVVAGLTTGCCVAATCCDAFHRDFNVFVVADGTDNYGAEAQMAALRSLSQTCGLVADAQGVLEAWRTAC
jgi:nicotinamidase-related amidase